MAAAPEEGASICRGLNKSSTSPESTSMPSEMREGTPLIPIMNSSKSVERAPFGSSRGTGEKSLPHA